MRADGWYWVRCEKWAESGIAYWKNESGGYWSVFGCDDFKDSDFTEIDETHIDRNKRYGIKPLEWVKINENKYVAQTPFGEYRIHYNKAWWVNKHKLKYAFYEMKNEIMEACESHYREQVMKCLTT